MKVLSATEAIQEIALYNEWLKMFANTYWKKY